MSGTLFEVFSEVMHQAGMLPLLVLAFRAHLREHGSARWVVAWALSLSWFADSAVELLKGFGVESYPTVVQLLVPVQCGILIALLADRINVKVLLCGALVLLSMLSAIQGFENLEGVSFITGHLVVAWYAQQGKLPRQEATALAVYFGGGAVMWVGVLALWDWRLAAWYGYQGTRLAGLLMLSWAMSRHETPKLRLLK